MPALIRDHWLDVFRAKIGITHASGDDHVLINDLLDLMAAGQADFTNGFRALAGSNARDQFSDPEAFDAWAARWRGRLRDEPDPVPIMTAANPAFVPRNHRIEQMIAAAVDGDYDLFHRLNAVLKRPFDDQPDQADLARPPAPAEVVAATFCGT